MKSRPVKIDSPSIVIMKRRSIIPSLLLSVLGGVALAFIIIVGGKALLKTSVAVGGFLKDKWYFLILGITALIFMKHFLGKKKIEVSHADPYR